MQFLIALAIALMTTAAFAQDNVQGADPEFTQKALSALQGQRNRAMDEAAVAEAQLAKVQKENVDLQKQIDDLKKAGPPK